MNEVLIFLLRVIGSISPFLGVWFLLNYLSNKSDKNANSNASTNYVVKSSGIITGIMWITFLVCSGFLIYAVIDNQLGWMVGISFGTFDIISFIGILNTVKWKVEVRDKDIIYRSTFGTVRKYQFNDISKGIYKKSGALRIYIAEKRIFTFDSNMDFSRFKEQMKNQRIPIYNSGSDSKRKKKRWK